MGKTKNITGQKYGRLQVVSKSDHKDKSNHSLWNCKCECGNTTAVSLCHLTSGKIKSCGCLRNEKTVERNTTHGKTHTRLFEIWQGMKKRCTNPKHKSFSYYGGRGIMVCDEWKNDFEAFYNWAMLNGYAYDLTIDRIDNNGNYEPSNCRWVTMAEQNQNKRNIRIK